MLSDNAYDYCKTYLGGLLKSAGRRFDDDTWFVFAEQLGELDDDTAMEVCRRFKPKYMDASHIPELIRAVRPPRPQDTEEPFEPPDRPRGWLSQLLLDGWRREHGPEEPMPDFLKKLEKRMQQDDFDSKRNSAVETKKKREDADQ